MLAVISGLLFPVATRLVIEDYNGIPRYIIAIHRFLWMYIELCQLCVVSCICYDWCTRYLPLR